MKKISPTCLPDELLYKYEQMFYMPEVLARTPGGYVAFPVPPDEEGGVGADNIPDRATVDCVRAESPPGTKVELLSMDGSQAPPV